jgi:hypothetical protein
MINRDWGSVCLLKYSKIHNIVMITEGSRIQFHIETNASHFFEINVENCSRDKTPTGVLKLKINLFLWIVFNFS